MTREDFEASTLDGLPNVRRASVSIAPLDSQVVTFVFDVPSFLPNGRTLCAQLVLGLEPNPLFNTARSQELFCMTKGDSGLRIMTEQETQAMFERSLAQPATR